MSKTRTRVRYEFDGILRVLSPLHVGSGETREIALVTGKKDAKKAPDVAAVVRDFKDRPYIPATTLKGALRRVAEQLEATGVLQSGCASRLFGLPKKDAGGQMGAVLFRGAALDQAPNARNLPYGQESGVFVAARAKIDRDTGCADDHKLFFQEMVAAGATFRFHLVLDNASEEAAEEEARMLSRILTELTTDDGVRLGKSQADGQGRLRLDGTGNSLNKRVLDSTGGFVLRNGGAVKVELANDAVRPSGVTAFWDLRLECPYPFMIVDSSWKPSGDADGVQLQAQRAQNNLPLVLGSSLTGALRARARWLKTLEKHGAGRPAEADRNDHVAATEKDVAELTTIERLFGVTGYRALLQVGRLVVTNAKPFYITSVKLDRFSGGPIDNALFKSSTFVGVQMTLRLELVRRPGDPGAAHSAEDSQFVNSLIDDICANGLELGHGTNKGFGWFNAHMEQRHGG